MSRSNVIFPIAKLPEVKALLDSLEGKFKIRYRGPRKTGYHTVNGVTYFRTKWNAMQDAVKCDATGFVVYAFKDVLMPVTSYRPTAYLSEVAYPLFPLSVA